MGSPTNSKIKAPRMQESGSTIAREPVHYAITVEVQDGKVAEFDEALVRFLKRSINYPGTTGVHLIRPVPGSDDHEYGILRSFESDAASRDFYNSDLFQQYKAETDHLVAGEAVTQPLHGLEAFFRDRNNAPPRWKMAIVTWLGVFPAVLFWSSLVGPLQSAWHPLLAMAVNIALVVISMAWLDMPWVTKFFQPWLQRR